MPVTLLAYNARIAGPFSTILSLANEKLEFDHKMRIGLLVINEVNLRDKNGCSFKSSQLLKLKHLSGLFARYNQSLACVINKHAYFIIESVFFVVPRAIYHIQPLNTN